MPTWVTWVLHLQHQLFSSLWMCFSCTALLVKVDIWNKNCSKSRSKHLEPAFSLDFRCSLVSHCSWKCNTPLKWLSLQMAVSFFIFVFPSFLPVTWLPSVLLSGFLDHFSFPSFLVCHLCIPQPLLPAIRSQSQVVSAPKMQSVFYEEVFASAVFKALPWWNLFHCFITLPIFFSCSCLPSSSVYPEPFLCSF